MRTWSAGECIQASTVPDMSYKDVDPGGSTMRNAGESEAGTEVAGTLLRDEPTTTSIPTAEQLLAEFDEELPTRKLPQALDRLLTFYCFAVSVFVLYQVFFPLREGNQFSLIVFLSATLPLTFLVYRARARRTLVGADAPSTWDWVLTSATVFVCTYPVLPWIIGDGGGGFNAFLDRQGSLGVVDVIAGSALTLIILEATRRTTGWVLPIFCTVFFLFAYYGGLLPFDWSIAHAGLNLDQIINGFYNDQSGFYGTPLNVAASYIVLFIIYGAVLSATGAGRFFVDFSFSLFRRSRAAAGRTVVTSGLLLGTVSGSGTATTVTLGSLAWPILKKAGYPRDNAGGMLAASGVGAILSPPTLGAAAFIIAEYLGVPYLEVIIWAVVPTLLFYTGIFVAVEIDARRYATRPVEASAARPTALLFRFGYHFLSLVIIIVFLAVGLHPFRAIVLATLVAALFGLAERIVSRRDPLDPESEVRPLGSALLIYAADLYSALATGVRSAIPVIAVCAAAGIITSVIVKTGLGLTLAQTIVSIGEALSSDAQVILVITCVLAAVAVTLLGLAVPVTASFIISWVVIGPALISLGVAGPEVAMFIFYYAVLAEVSPPTSLAAVAAAAITGGGTIRTMMQALKYALPAYMAPLAFVLTPAGGSLVLQGDLTTSAWATAVSLVAVAALAATTGGWVFGRMTRIERLILLVGSLFCLYLEPVSIATGLSLITLGAVVNYVRVKRDPTLTRGDAVGADDARQRTASRPDPDA